MSDVQEVRKPIAPDVAMFPDLFTPWRDPESNVQSFILSRRVAPVQMSFYFTNPSFTDHGRFLWFYCQFPPAHGHFGAQLAVVDFGRGEVRHYPETAFMDASPYVDCVTGEVYWTIGLEIWKRGPNASDRSEFIGSFPGEIANNRRPRRIATHLTRSADGRSLSLDAEFSPEWHVGDIPIDGCAPASIWQTFDRCYNHVQFSPTDPNLLLIAQDGWTDSATGIPGSTYDRLWLLRRGEQATQIFPDDPSIMRGHEWWDADGDHVWYIDYRKGTEKVNIHTGRRETVWSSGHTHSHCDRTGRYLVGDILPGADDWRLAFYNVESGKQVEIVTRFPVFTDDNGAGRTALTALTPAYRRANYHIHPHPQFCCNDRYIAYTTNVLGQIDVALTSVDQLIALTR